MQKGSKQTEEAKKLQSIGTRKAHARRRGEEPSTDPIEEDFLAGLKYERRAQRRLEKKMIEDALKKMGL